MPQTQWRGGSQQTVKEMFTVYCFQCDNPQVCYAEFLGGREQMIKIKRYGRILRTQVFNQNIASRAKPSLCWEFRTQSAQHKHSSQTLRGPMRLKTGFLKIAGSPTQNFQMHGWFWPTFKLQAAASRKRAWRTEHVLLNNYTGLIKAKEHTWNTSSTQ